VIEHFLSRCGRSPVLQLFGGIGVAVCCTTVPLTALTQGSQPPREAASAPATPPPVEPAYRIGPGDLLSMQVFGLKDFDQVTRVSNSGKVHVRYVGVLKVADMTIEELQKKIAQELRDRGLMKDPWVEVRIEQYRAQPVYILGEVMNPGQFMMTNDMRVVDLITWAAGINDVASPTGYLYRRTSVPPPADATETAGDSKGDGSVKEVAATTDEAIPIDLQAALVGSPDANLLLQAGDVLYVPQERKQYFYVVGDVLKAGAYELTSDRTVLLTEAISRAGGPTRTAKTSKAVVVRFAKDGTFQQLPFDFQAVLRGRKPNLPVRGNDIIFVPGSSAKTVAYGLLNVFPGVLAGSLIYR